MKDKTTGAVKKMKNDWTTNCYWCGSDNLRLVEDIQQSITNRITSLTPFYGVECLDCRTCKMAATNYPDSSVLRHIRWWYFGKEFESQSGRPAKYKKQEAMSIRSRLSP